MAIAYGTLSSLNTTGTYNAPTISGSDVLGVVFHMGDTSDNCTGITWEKGGVATAMTKAVGFARSGGRYIYMYYIVNPDSGGQIVISGSSLKYSRAGYYTGVNQTTPVEITNGITTANSTSLPITVNPVNVANSWLVYFTKDENGSITYSTNVGIMRMGGTADGTGMAVGDSNGVVATGSNTVTLTASGSTQNGQIIMAISPSTTSSTKIKSWNGVSNV